MTPGERLKDWIEGLAQAWGDRLRNWLTDWIATAIVRFIEGIEPEGLDFVDESLDLIEKTPGVPDFIKRLIGKIRAGGKPIPLLIAIPIGILLLVPMIFGLMQPLGSLFNYVQERIFHSYRFDPLSVLTAWRRDPEKYAWAIDDLRDLGFTDQRIEALKFLTQFLPNADEQTLWLAREVFEPDMIRKYGLDAELPVYEDTDFAKIGVTPEQMTNKWRAHWQHASWIQIIEMLHRGLIPEEDVYSWFRLVEIPPFWRDLLIQTAYTWPTRVDVRRWWDMRTIDEARLRELYEGMGYRGKNLDDYILWTKVYTDFPMMMSRFSNGWITEEDIRSWLRGLEIPKERIEQFIQEKTKPEKPKRTTAEKDLTKTDIYKGVKQDRISRGEGLDLLMDLGYDENEADYLLAINIPMDEEDVKVKERELTKADVKAAVKAQLLSPAEATTRLIQLRYSRADAEFLTSMFQRLIPIEKVEEARELTKGDVVRALRQGILTPDETLNILVSLAYSPEDARFLVSTNMPPVEVIADVKEITEEYQVTAGLEALPLPEVERERQLAKTDIKSAFKQGLITADQAISRLTGLGYSPEDARFLITLLIVVTDLEKITIPSEEAKANIVVAVKKGLTVPEEAYLMLLDIGFTPEASQFILDVHAEEAPFSPINFTEFKDLTTRYKIATGREAKPMPEELKQAAQHVRSLTNELEALNRSIAEEEKGLIPVEEIPEEAAARLKELQVARNRAISELERTKSEYDRLVAEWKHGLP